MPLILLNKPFHVLSQFSESAARRTLRDYVANPAVYPAGRLDFDSEGLLLLTNDGRMQARISQPRAKLAKHYHVQVEGIATEEHLHRLRCGVQLNDGSAVAVHAALVDEPAELWERDPPIRMRKSVPTTWIDLAITTGRNRQVRRMTAAVGLPTLRLIRHRIGPFALNGLQPGKTRELALEEAWRCLDTSKNRP